MEIQETSQREVARFLHHAEASGWNWVAFSARPNEDQRPPVFEGFISAAEAQAYCNDNGVSRSYPYEDDPYDVREEYMDYRFMPVDTLQKTYQMDKEIKVADLPLSSLTEKMSSQSIQFLPGLSVEQVQPLLQSGAVFPVQWNNMINPAQEVDRFLVVAHRHAGHQVYEIGHSIRVVDSFSYLEKAEACFKEQVRQYTDNTDKNDYLLIGHYKGRELIQDMEGWPESYSGITLRTANYQYDPDLQAKVWNVQEINTLDEPKGIRHFLYARFGLNSEKLTLYNDRLQEIKPEELKVSTYPDQFNYETLTIKNSIAMEINMKNYDYLKNQVKFMGFGEDLDKAIKEKMESGAPEFILSYEAKFGKGEINTDLHFGKSNGGELYFFNRVDMTFRQPGMEEALKQTYFIGKENNYTLKERYNMLDGRAVYKELNKLAPVGEGEDRKYKATDQTYKAWKELDFKQTDARGNFLTKTMFWNHEKAIQKYPIKELETPYDRSRLLASLEKGNITKMTAIKDGEEIKGATVAKPRQEDFDFYDSNNQRMELKQVEVQKAQKQEQGENNTIAQDNQPLGQGQNPNVKVSGENNGPEQQAGGAKVVHLQNNPADQPDAAKQQDNKPAESVGIVKENKKEDQKPSLKNDNKDESKKARRQRMRMS
jgi:hypothetical protein